MRHNSTIIVASEPLRTHKTSRRARYTSQTESAYQLRKNGAVYTPRKLADYVAGKILEYTVADSSFPVSGRISIVDPACGDGVLLESQARAMFSSTFKRVVLCGLDIDNHAISSCKRRLTVALGNDTDLHLINTNALCPFGEPSLKRGWSLIFQQTTLTGGFDILVANPPWGADILEYRKQLEPDQFSSLQGQVDSFELFVELASKIVRKGGYFGFIVPDSMLNHGKSTLRELLLNSTEIKFVARLGEKIFPNVNRGCVIIICKNTPPESDNLVDCFRLSKRARRMVLSGRLSFREAEISAAHKVPQTRFAANPYKQFDIDLREREALLLGKLTSSKNTLGDVLRSTRGVELGSSGNICQCESCKTWAPLSQRKSIRCVGCGRVYDPRRAKRVSIVTQKPRPNSVSLVTGSSLRRYVVTPSRWIELGKKGINYKTIGTYAPSKILIRKTGVGLTAALDYTNSYTNQVVYILRGKNPWPSLEFFIGLINSRVYYFILVKSFGETEWRSHPYLTQSQILSLPLTNLEGDESRMIIDQITGLLRPVLERGRPSRLIDLEVESLIARLFHLTRSDYETIFKAIDESDELLPVRELKDFDREEFFARLER